MVKPENTCCRVVVEEMNLKLNTQQYIENYITILHNGIKLHVLYLNIYHRLNSTNQVVCWCCHHSDRLKQIIVCKPYPLDEAAFF